MHRITDKIGAVTIIILKDITGSTCSYRCSACATHGWTGQNHHMAIDIYICSGFLKVKCGVIRARWSYCM